MKTEKPVFDMDHAREITDGDMEFLKELIEIFSDDCPERTDAISKAIKGKDFKALNEATHALKGSAGNLGLSQIYELSYTLEKMGKTKNIDDANEVFKTLKEEIQRFNTFISIPGWEEK